MSYAIIIGERTIFKATLDDVEELMIILERLKKDHQTDFSYDLSAHRELLIVHLQSDNSCLFFTYNALIGAYLEPVGYNKSVMVAAVWISSSNGQDGDLTLQAIERWAREKRATHIMMETAWKGETDPNTERVRKRFFMQKGFYLKRMGWLKSLV